MASNAATGGAPEPPAVEVREATKQEIDERVAGWTDGELLLHRRLNRNEQAPGIFGDMPNILAMLRYEEAAIERELSRRGVESTD
jgi:hypothetical protein